MSHNLLKQFPFQIREEYASIQAAKVLLNINGRIRYRTNCLKYGKGTLISLEHMCISKFDKRFEQWEASYL